MPRETWRKTTTQVLSQDRVAVPGVFKTSPVTLISLLLTYLTEGEPSQCSPVYIPLQRLLLLYVYIYIACLLKSLALTAPLMSDGDEAKPCHPSG